MKYPKCREMPLFYNGTYYGCCEREPEVCKRCRKKFRELNK